MTLAAHAHAAPRYSLTRAALYMVAATACFTGMAACIQVASRGVPSAEVVFVRSLLGLLFLLPWLLMRGGWTALRTQRPRDHLVRSAAGLGSMYCYVFALGHLPLADAIVLNFTAPLFFPVLESAWMGEPMSRKIWWPLLLGFAGIVVVLKPGSAMFTPVALIGLLAGMLSAIAQTGVRTLTRTEPPERIVFIFALSSSLASAAPAAAVWVTPSAALFGVFMLLGLTATVGQLSMTRAYSHAPASEVGAFAYSVVIFGALFDWLSDGKPPSWTFFVGAALICSAGVLILRLTSARSASARQTPSEVAYGRERKPQ